MENSSQTKALHIVMHCLIKCSLIKTLPTVDRLQGEGSTQVQNLSSVPTLGPPTVVILGGYESSLENPTAYIRKPFFQGHNSDVSQANVIVRTSGRPNLIYDKLMANHIVSNNIITLGSSRY